MNLHSKAKLTPLSRAEMIKRILDLHQPVALVAAAFGLSQRRTYTWLARFRAEGHAGLQDRSSRRFTTAKSISKPCRREEKSGASSAGCEPHSGKTT